MSYANAVAARDAAITRAKRHFDALAPTALQGFPDAVVANMRESISDVLVVVRSGEGDYDVAAMEGLWR